MPARDMTAVMMASRKKELILLTLFIRCLR